MKTKTILIGLVVIAVIGFGIQAAVSNTTQLNNPTEDKKTGSVQVAINDLGIFESADRAGAVARFAGKPAVIFIVSTACPHCQVGMPKYKAEIYDMYKDTVNIFANVANGHGGNRFAVADIPQGFDAQLDFNILTGNECGYVPSWVMLNASGKMVDSSCGAAKSIDDIKKGLDAQLETKATVN